MEWQLILALVIGVPVILFPVAFIWSINIGHLYMIAKRAYMRRAERRKNKKELLKPAYQQVAHVAKK